MNQKNNGGPAYPVPGLQDDESFNGMSLRDYFAGQALAGLMANLPKTMYGLDWERNVAQGAYLLADAMLAERAK